MLPLAGGLFDQPAGYVTRMENVLRAQAEQELAQINKQEAENRLARRMKEMESE